MMLKVFDKPCQNCLLSDSRIVSPERKNQLIQDSLKKDTYFICHKANDVCCHSFFKKHKQDTMLLRFAVAFDCVEVVPHTDNEKLVSWKDMHPTSE